MLFDGFGLKVPVSKARFLLSRFSSDLWRKWPLSRLVSKNWWDNRTLFLCEMEIAPHNSRPYTLNTYSLNASTHQKAVVLLRRKTPYKGILQQKCDLLSKEVSTWLVGGVWQYVTPLGKDLQQAAEGRRRGWARRAWGRPPPPTVWAPPPQREPWLTTATPALRHQAPVCCCVVALWDGTVPELPIHRLVDWCLRVLVWIWNLDSVQVSNKSRNRSCFGDHISTTKRPLWERSSHVQKFNRGTLPFLWQKNGSCPSVSRCCVFDSSTNKSRPCADVHQMLSSGERIQFNWPLGEHNED